MQQTTRVAVLATQLAQTDRRALSQAWYSALHLAGRSGLRGHQCKVITPAAAPRAVPASTSDG